jgi:hypothetical protein
MKSRAPLLVLALLLVAMAALMITPMRDETATVDETTFMGGGYGHFKTGSAKMAEENPLLGCMVMAAPMLAFDVHVNEQARALMEGKAFSPMAWPWFGPPRRFEELFPRGPNWYHYGLPESQFYGQILVYDPRNDAERLMFWSRVTQLLVTLATAAFLFFWAHQLTGHHWAGVMAAGLWGLSPVTLGYGHLAIAEPGVTLMFPIVLWWLTTTLANPSYRNWLILGALTAVAMGMKHLAIMLGPIFVVVLALVWWRQRSLPAPAILAKRAGCLVAGFWVATLIIFFPHWSPPPPVEPTQAQALNVPGWFQACRPLLIPGDFFKAVTLKVLHSRAGHNAYLLGQWSDTGWWYYFPAVIFFKTPVPLLALLVAGTALVIRKARQLDFAALMPWIAAAVYVLAALPNKVSIGVRHMYPIYPLLAVGIADQLFRAGRKWQIGGWIAGGLLAVIAALNYPHFISYCNEFAGGTKNGYRALIDSNYDWGQDGKRLKAWMQQNNVPHVYLDYFGTQASIEWHKIPNTRVNAEQARQLREGWLVVSVSQLMRPEWGWLRESRPPVTRIAHTLFVYRLP